MVLVIIILSLYESRSDLTDIVVKYLTVEVDAPAGYLNGDNQAQYDAAASQFKTWPQGSKTGKIKYTVNTDKSDGIVLSNGKSVTFTIFLPPVADI